MSLKNLQAAANKSDTNPSASLPDLIWRKTTCRICGKSFDYSGQRAPVVCRDGECRYKFHFKIKPHTWADYQPTFFDKKR